MFIQTLNNVSPKHYSSNERSPSRTKRPRSAHIQSIAAFNEFAYVQKELQLKNAPHSCSRRQFKHKRFVNFDGSTHQQLELNAQSVRPSMYLFSADNECNFVTLKTPDVETIRFKSSNAKKHRTSPKAKRAKKISQQPMFLPELAHNDSIVCLGNQNNQNSSNSPTLAGSTFRYAFATTKVSNPSLQRKKKRKTTIKPNHSDVSDLNLTMSASIMRARLANQIRKQSIQYTARATNSMIQQDQNNYFNATFTSGGDEHSIENEDGNISSRPHSSRSISPLNDESHYHANIAKNRQIARQRAAAAAKLMKRNKNNPETKIVKTDRHRYRDEKIKTLTCLKTQMKDQKFTIWFHILKKESWNNEIDMFGSESQWLTCGNDDAYSASQISSKMQSQDIDQVQTIINGKDAKQFFDDLEAWN